MLVIGFIDGYERKMLDCGVIGMMSLTVGGGDNDFIGVKR